MATTFSIMNNLLYQDGENTYSAKQGALTSGFTDRYKLSDVLTLNNAVFQRRGQLATATVITIFDDDSDYPQDFQYLHFWCSVKMYLQIITTSNVVIPILAYTPFVLPGFDALQIAANTTLITGGTEPTPVDIDSIALGNYSGGTGDYCLTLVY